MICSICNKEIHAHSFNDFTMFEDKFAHTECMEHYRKCSFCNHYHHEDDMVQIVGESYCCKDCLKENNIHLTRCKRCGCLIIENQQMVSSIVSYTFIRYFSKSHEGYCKNCFELTHRRCNCFGCCNYSIDGHEYCEHHIGLAKFKQYSYKPFPEFKSINKDEINPLYIGVELELNFTNENDKLDFLKNWDDNFLYFKRDASLAKDGVEMVSHPATIQYHIQSNIWNKLFDMLSKYKMNTENCGLHFHLSRKFFDNESISSLDYIVNNYGNIINEIGSRGYTTFANKVKTRTYGDARRSAHYDACNLCNDATIELRFCKSTYNFKSFMKKLKMIFILAMFATKVNKDYIDDKERINKLFNFFKTEILSRI